MDILLDWEYTPVNHLVTMYMVYSKDCSSKDLIKNCIQNLSEIPGTDIQPGTPCSDSIPNRDYSHLALPSTERVSHNNTERQAAEKL